MKDQFFTSRRLQLIKEHAVKIGEIYHVKGYKAALTLLCQAEEVPGINELAIKLNVSQEEILAIHDDHQFEEFLNKYYSTFVNIMEIYYDHLVKIHYPYPQPS